MDAELRYEQPKVRKRRTERPKLKRPSLAWNAAAQCNGIDTVCCTQSWIGIECDPCVEHGARLTGDRFRPIRSMELIPSFPRRMIPVHSQEIKIPLNENFSSIFKPIICILLNMHYLNNIYVKYNSFNFMYIFFICNKHSYSKHI